MKWWRGDFGDEETGWLGDWDDKVTGRLGRLDDWETGEMGWEEDLMTGRQDDEETIGEGGLVAEWRVFIVIIHVWCYLLSEVIRFWAIHVLPHKAFSNELTMICDYLYSRAKAHSSVLLSHDLKVVVNIYLFAIRPKGRVINSNS